MAQIEIIETELKGVKIIRPAYLEDFRGYYCETYSSRTMNEYGINIVFVQDNHSYTIKKGTIRGIHFQNNPKPQVKLVRCTKGRIMDFAVDLRKDSPNYKKWIQTELSACNRKQILIPSGFGHAFITLEDNCEVLYKFSDFYDPELYKSLSWNDPQLGISWGIDNPIMSEKDLNAPTMECCEINL